MEKRGLSDVVTTVLIILLVLAAVVIIWSFVRPAIQSGAGKVSGACVELDLTVESCEDGTAEVLGTCVGGDDATPGCKALSECGTSATACNDYVAAAPSGAVRVSRGTDSATIKDVVLVYTVAGQSVRRNTGKTVSALGSIDYTPTATTGGVLSALPTDAVATAEVETEAGETILCTPTAVKKPCS